MALVYAKPVSAKLEVHAGQDDQAVTDLTSMEHEFIKRYEQLPLLWKKDHPDYSNKYKRNVAYDILLPILRTFSPSANRFNVRQKINILRSSYRKELRKYYASKTITENGEIIFTHTPPSWKFAAMKFLQDWNGSEVCDLSQSEIVIEETVEDDSVNDLEEQELVFIQDPEMESANEDIDITENPISPVYVEKKEVKPIIIKNPRNRNNFNDSIIIDHNIHINEEQDVPENSISPVYVGTKEVKPIIIKNPRKRSSYNDSIMIDRECTAIGSNVTCKLQRMNNDQRNYAEQLINKVLMRGLKRTLSEDTDFTDGYVQTNKVEC